MTNRTSYQERVIRNYYQNRDAIALQKLSEMVTDLYLAEGKSQERLWGRVAAALEKLDVPKSRVDHLVASRNPSLVANLVKSCSTGSEWVANRRAVSCQLAPSVFDFQDRADSCCSVLTAIFRSGLSYDAQQCRSRRRTAVEEVPRAGRRVRLPGRRDGRRPGRWSQAARVSYGEGTRRVSDDRTLIRYLMRHQHTTPFEMAELKLLVRVPMDCWRQWIRHRTASINEYSTRYSIAIDAGQKTPPEAWRRQSATNRQGSEGFLDAGTGGELSAARGPVPGRGPAALPAAARPGRRPRAGPQGPAAVDLHRGLLEDRPAQPAALSPPADGPARAVGDSPSTRGRSATRSCGRCFRWSGRRSWTTGSQAMSLSRLEQEVIARLAAAAAPALAGRRRGVSRGPGPDLGRTDAVPRARRMPARSSCGWASCAKKSSGRGDSPQGLQIGPFDVHQAVAGPSDGRSNGLAAPPASARIIGASQRDSRTTHERDTPGYDLGRVRRRPVERSWPSGCWPDTG